MALEGFLGIRVILLEMRRRAVLVWLLWRCVPGREKKIFQQKNLYFCEETFRSFFRGLWAMV